MSDESEQPGYNGVSFTPADNGNDDPFSLVVDSMPEPTPGVAEREEAKLDESDAKESENRGKYVDGDGNPFDPSIHVTDANGDPVLTTRGKCRKRPGRKSGDGPRRQSTLNTGNKTGAVPDSSPEQSADELNKVKARQAGTLAGNVAINTLVMAGGDEFSPRGEKEAGYDERKLMQEAFADYFEAKGYTDFPPGIALTAVLFAYVAPRFQMPKTQNRMAKALGWFKRKRDEKRKQQAKQERKDGKRDWRGRPAEEKDKG